MPNTRTEEEFVCCVKWRTIVTTISIINIVRKTNIIDKPTVHSFLIEPSKPFFKASLRELTCKGLRHKVSKAQLKMNGQYRGSICSGFELSICL